LPVLSIPFSPIISRLRSWLFLPRAARIGQSGKKCFFAHIFRRSLAVSAFGRAFRKGVFRRRAEQWKILFHVGLYAGGRSLQGATRHLAGKAGEGVSSAVFAAVLPCPCPAGQGAGMFFAHNFCRNLWFQRPAGPFARECFAGGRGAENSAFLPVYWLHFCPFTGCGAYAGGLLCQGTLWRRGGIPHFYIKN